MNDRRRAAEGIGYHLELGPLDWRGWRDAFVVFDDDADEMLAGRVRRSGLGYEVLGHGPLALGTMNDVLTPEDRVLQMLVAGDRRLSARADPGDPFAGMPRRPR